MSMDPDVSRLKKVIDQMIHERRPDRYILRNTIENDLDVAPFPDVSALLDPDAPLGDEAETAWLDAIAEEIAPQVPITEVRKLYARKLVGELEGRATKRANKLLREIGRNGQLILGWWGYESDPIAVVTRKVVQGERPRVKEERVALRAMAARDFRQFAVEERRRASKDFSARNDTCSGAELLADQMEQAGARLFHDWAIQELPPPLD